MKFSVSSVSINTVIKGAFNNVSDSNTTIDPHRQNFYVHYDSFILFHNQCSYILYVHLYATDTKDDLQKSIYMFYTQKE
jgi:hypothetical protein